MDDTRGTLTRQVHTVDQHLIFTSGICKAIVGGEEKEVKAGDLVIVPQGTKHNCESHGGVDLCSVGALHAAEPGLCEDPR